MLTLFIKSASFQALTGRTSKGVSFSVVGESFFGKDDFFATGTLLALFQRIKMCLYATIPAGQIIFDAPVFAVSYRSFNCGLGVVFVVVD